MLVEEELQSTFQQLVKVNRPEAGQLVWHHFRNSLLTKVSPWWSEQLTSLDNIDDISDMAEQFLKVFECYL